MSYDLYFYKRKSSDITEEKIAEYLNNKVATANDLKTQWLVGDPDALTYFSIIYTSNGDDFPESEIFEQYEPTNFSFNLNYIRPDFFGQYAFEFVDRFLNELDLFVLNPQSATDAENPMKPNAGELYTNWSELNARISADSIEKCGLQYYPLEKSNYFYDYNRGKSKMQAALGYNYYVPQIFLCRRISDGELITLCAWSEHIPQVFPLVDYVVLTKKYTKLFRRVKEVGVIRAKTLNDRFGHLLEDFDFKDCKILHPDNAKKAGKLFNETTMESGLADFADSVQIELVTNVRVQTSGE